jgi:hypothetical protein
VEEVTVLAGEVCEDQELALASSVILRECAEFVQQRSWKSMPLPESDFISVMFEVQALGSSNASPGIRVLAVGSGGTEETASSDAAKQWALGVLPVIVSYMLRSHVCEVGKMPVIVGVQDSEERYG